MRHFGVLLSWMRHNFQACAMSIDPSSCVLIPFVVTQQPVDEKEQENTIELLMKKKLSGNAKKREANKSKGRPLAEKPVTASESFASRRAAGIIELSERIQRLSSAFNITIS